MCLAQLKIIDQQPSDIEFIPMIWTGSDLSRVQEIIDNDVVPAFKSGRTKRLLGFNEPDSPMQADMSVETAVNLWKALESTEMPLASPCVSVGGIETWMKAWNKEAYDANLRVDYIAVHWYSWPKADRFKAFMKEMYEIHGSRTPLLLTEFAPADWSAKSPEENSITAEEVLDFMKEVLPWMERQDWIAGYAWFPFRPSFAAGSSSALFEEDGTPTPLADYYASVTPENPSGDQSISY
jgi:Glycosyl hydrolase catalytic core